MSLAIPLLLLYEGSIWSVKIVEGKARPRPKAAKPPPKPRRVKPDRAQVPAGVGRKREAADAIAIPSRLRR